MEPTLVQRDIINEEGNTVVLASPGSGKTFVMSEKIKRLLAHEAMRDYQGVIAISYTRKASSNLKRRALSDGIWEKNSFFGTIDSFCLTQIVLPFGSFVMGYSEEEVMPIEVKELPEETQVDFVWIDKIHPDYEDIGGATWERLYRLYCDGKVLISSLELLALRIIKECPACRTHLKARFKYVFIDEYQDADTYTNGILLELISMGVVANVVGDVNQSIFAFAHKKSEYLEALETRDDMKAFRLKDNHRCSAPIVNYSNRLLDENVKLLETEEDGVELIKVNGDEEKVAAYLTDYIKEDCEKWKVDDLSQVAILVTNSRTQTYIDNNLGIPHVVVKSTPLDNDVNPRSRLYTQLLQYYFDDKMPFMAIVNDNTDYDLLTRMARKRLGELRDEVRSVEEEEIGEEFPRLFKRIADILLPKYQEGSSLSHLQTVLNDEKMVDSYRPLTENEVVIMTLHKAKGLEFDIVYHLNLNEWELPKKKIEDNDFDHPIYPTWNQDLDLHYVGVTRAKKACVLITNSQRHNFNDEVKRSRPSEFLSMNGLEELRKNYTYD